MIYECMNDKCGCIFKGKNEEGLRCPKCGDAIFPMPEYKFKGTINEIPTYKEVINSNMVAKKTWQEFKDTGLLWWINMILHTFGWAITLNVEEDGTITGAYPSRVKFRGFDGKSNDKGYQKISKYLLDNIEQIEKESRM